ncbi:Transcription factor bHLH122 [Linum perenne]
MEPDLQQHHHFLNDDQQPNQKQMNPGGLTRYQSAPSSYFTSYLEKELCDELFNRPSSPETERFFARFLANTAGEPADVLSDQNLAPIKPVSPPMAPAPAPAQSQSYYPPSQSRPPLPSDYRTANLPPLPTVKAESCGGNNSNLVRHSSSPAGLFSNINIEFENGIHIFQFNVSCLPILVLAPKISSLFSFPGKEGFLEEERKGVRSLLNS